MRTTPREKLVIWANGLILAVVIELLLRSQAGPLSSTGLVLFVPTLALMALVTTVLLRWRS
jgi:hypothetical protein